MRREFGLPITAITGPATDNEVGQVYITTGLGLAGAQRAAGRGGAAGGGAAGARRLGGEQEPADDGERDAAGVARAVSALAGAAAR